MRMLLFALILVIEACQSDAVQKSCSDLKPDTNWDSLRINQILFQKDYVIDSLYEIRPLSEYDTVISLRLHDGWGMFDYYATLYTQFGKPKSELFEYVGRKSWFSWHDSLVPQPHRGFAKKQEHVISMEALKQIIQLLDTCDFWCTNHNANNCWTTFDGESWLLSVKLGNKTHHVFWTNCDTSPLDTGCINRCREMEHIATKVFLTAGFRKDKTIEITEPTQVGKDSLSYYVFAPVLFPDYLIYFRSKALQDGNLTVSKRDKTWYKQLEIEEISMNDTIRYKPSQFIWRKE